MKKTQLSLVLGCFVLATILYLLDFVKITTSAGGVVINIYPAAGFALLGLVLLWHAYNQRNTAR